MHYNPSVLEAFNSVEHIMRDVNNGWLIRYLHSNTASAFFFLVYLHIGKGLYYGSYRAPRTLVWTIGTVIFILMMATAFLGYYVSPKWLINLNLNSIFTILFIIFISSLTFNFKRNYTSYSSESDGDNNEGKENNSFPKKGGNINTLLNFLTEYELKPVYTFNNLKSNEIKEDINTNLKGLSGIYLMFNKVTGDYYIGSASTDRFYARFYSHLISLKGSKILKNAVRKYGIDNFSFIVLELFPEVVNKENNKKLLDLEDFYLKWLLPNYNILTEAGNSFGYKHTELSRIKMKSNYSQSRHDQIVNLNKGNKLSKETIEKIRESALKIHKKVFSEQSLLNLKNNSKAIVLYNLDRTVFGEYLSIVEAANAIHCYPRTINRALKTEKKIVKRRFIVAYKARV